MTFGDPTKTRMMKRELRALTERVPICESKGCLRSGRSTVKMSENREESPEQLKAMITELQAELHSREEQIECLQEDLDVVSAKNANRRAEVENLERQLVDNRTEAELERLRAVENVRGEHY